ncbi:MAG TPA: hypothetical protein PLP27_10515 [Crocinitomicaceae bacterium]|nr:hypothetical protein [Crocinitomicaceae bacterium]
MEEKSKDKLLLTLHEQFSTNQNDTSSRFVTLFIGLLILFGAYGISYGIATGIIEWSSITTVEPNAVLMLAIVVAVVLTFLIVLQIYMGYQHRRDQLINDKIRKKCIESDDEYEYFFNGYSGKGKKRWNYMPDYILIYIVFLSVCKILLLISVLFLKKNNLPKLNGCFFWATLIICIAGFFIIYFSLRGYYKKYKAFSIKSVVNEITTICNKIIKELKKQTRLVSDTENEIKLIIEKIKELKNQTIQESIFKDILKHLIEIDDLIEKNQLNKEFDKVLKKIDIIIHQLSKK